MKAVTCKNSTLSIQERPDPKPGKGQLLLRVLRCGICGSDLHARHYCAEYGNLAARIGYQRFPKPDEDLIFGHEFCGEVIGHGPDTPKTLKEGAVVCAGPVLRNGDKVDMIGLSAFAPGAYAEQVVVEASMAMPVPNGLPPDLAALTEPMAVAWHAVRRGEVPKNGVAIVIGCGPVGLAVVSMLKAHGVKTVVASDFSPGRRALAQQCGADVVIDPAKESPYKDWKQYEFIGGLDGLLDLAVYTCEKLGKLPVPWWHTWNLVEKLGLKPKMPVIFECVGIPKVLNSILEGAPMFSRVVVVGVCMQEDRIEPALGIHKEIDLRFVLGYSPLEYRQALHMLAEGKVKCAHLITGTVGLEGVDAAFSALGDPERHAKILIDPQQAGTAIV